MHVGRSNAKHQYKLGNNILKKSSKEWDLGVIVDELSLVLFYNGCFS